MKLKLKLKLTTVCVLMLVFSPVFFFQMLVLMGTLVLVTFIAKLAIT